MFWILLLSLSQMPFKAFSTCSFCSKISTFCCRLVLLSINFWLSLFKLLKFLIVEQFRGLWPDMSLCLRWHKPVCFFIKLNWINHPKSKKYPIKRPSNQTIIFTMIHIIYNSLVLPFDRNTTSFGYIFIFESVSKIKYFGANSNLLFLLWFTIFAKNDWFGWSCIRLFLLAGLLLKCMLNIF